MHSPASHSPPAARRIKLFVGLPIYSQVPAFFLQSLLALQSRKPLLTPEGDTIEIVPEMCQGDGVARSRNQLTASFLASDCTHLLFIDCDLIFGADQVARIVSLDQDIVGGLYPKKQEGPIEWVLNGCFEQTTPDERGLQEVRYIGTGFMCIKRRVFELMIDQYPEIAFHADYGKRRDEHDFWSMGVYEYPDKTRRYLSEDWFFCQRWLDIGGKVYADLRIRLKHIGPAIYPLKTQEAEMFKADLAMNAQGAPELTEGDALPIQLRNGEIRTPCASDGSTDLCIGRGSVSSPSPGGEGRGEGGGKSNFDPQTLMAEASRA